MAKLKKKVFVGVSGGVDSSVSLALLKKQGYDVVGVFIRTWQPDFIKCTWREERRDAIRVCAHLNVPFLECDAEEAYRRGVGEYMIEEYKNGRTPNPDVMCNREVKFGVFWEFARSHGADYIATGHYAEVRREGSRYSLYKGKDPEKDQSYFLWTLTEEDLSHVLFPVGNLKKNEVRKLAESFGLPTAQKKDSQGVCFLGPLDMKDFLRHYIEPTPGKVINTKGETIGTHSGAVFYTLGERHGFTVTEKQEGQTPLYVLEKDTVANTVTVTETLEEYETSPKKIFLDKVNWINGVPKNKAISIQMRYRELITKSEIITTEKNTAEILVNKSSLPSVGQSCVMYSADRVCGGGIISSYTPVI